MKKEKKTRLFKIMFTESKFKELEEKAKDKGQTIKQYILRHYIEE